MEIAYSAEIYLQRKHVKPARVRSGRFELAGLSIHQRPTDGLPIVPELRDTKTIGQTPRWPDALGS